MRKLRHIFTTALMALTLLAWSNVGWGQVIISQYYEGASNNKWIEITNLGDTDVDLTSPQLYLCLYTNTNADSPTEETTIGNTETLSGTITAGSSILYKNSSAVLPAYATGTSSSICNFNGDDLIILTSASGTGADGAWNNRIDIVGNGESWGGDKSFVRKSSILTPKTIFDINDWDEYTLTQVEDATETNTERLGFHVFDSAPDTEAPVPTFFPLDGATGVAVDVNPTITFDEPIYTSPGVAVDNNNVESLITFTAGVNPVAFTATITGNVITVVPAAELLNETAYTLIVSIVQDEAGNAMAAPASATFTTISATAETIELTGTYAGPYYAGEDVTVTWNAANFDNVVVETWVPSENAGAGGWVTMVASTPAVDGTATFTVPADAEYSAEYKIRVADAADGDPFAETANFKVREVHTALSTLITRPTNTEARFDGSAVVTYSRTARGQKFVQDANAAILIDDNSGIITQEYPIGSEITGLIGKINIYNALVQIIPLADPGAPVSTGNAVVPFETTLGALTAADQSKLIKLVDVSFTSTGTFAASQNYDIQDNSKAAGKYRTAFSESDYIGQAIPTQNIDEMIALVGQNYATIQLTSRSTADWTMPSNDATLATFTIGGESALGLNGLVVADPVIDAGATMFVTTFSGIVATATDAAATVEVKLDGTVVAAGDLATQALADGNVIVVTVTAQDNTVAYYKVTLSADTRELTLTAPVGVNNYNTGENIVFTWTSANIANVNLYAVDAGKAVNLINEEGPIVASLGTYTFTVTNGDFGSYRFRIADALDADFYNETTDASTITDTQAPAVVGTYPVTGAVDMPISFTLMAELDEDIQVATGNLTIHKVSDDAVVATITEADATALGEVITAQIAGLAWETAYYVNITAGMIQDLAGNNLPAITDQSWTFTTKAQPASDLFFSEYIEGSSNNKALEIYNPTGAPVDLSNYVIKSANNGNGWGNTSGGADTRYVLPLAGTLEPGEVLVLANAASDPLILAVADFTYAFDGVANNSIGNNVLAFNGDDAIGLFKNDVLIDIIGDPDSDPGTNWPVAGTGATSEYTLVRKSTVEAGNTDWAASAGTNAENSEWIVYPVNTFTFLGWHGLNAEAEILMFGVDAQMASAVIDPVAATITLEVLNGTNLATLVPEFTLSLGATASIAAVEQESGVSVVDFTNPVQYIVTPEDGVTEKVWTVTITEAAVSTEAQILSFSFAAQIGPATIDSDAGTIEITVAPNTVVTALVPTIEISLGATISPLSGVAQDFTSAVPYTVTAQDATTTKVWTVTVTISNIISIYDIQYTPAPSGASPYEGQVVTTTGIVTAHHFNKEGGVFKGVFIQDGAGAYKGLYVFNEFMVDIPNVGDEIVVSGKVEEYYTLTELTTASGTVPMSITVLTTGNELPAPTVLTTAEAAKEAWEGVLVQVKNAEYTIASDNFGVLGVNDGSGVVYIDDDMFDYRTAGVIEINKRYNITGIGHFSFDYAKILPRFALDIELASSVETVWGASITAYPNPFTSTITINNIENASRVVIVNLIGQQVMSINLNGANSKEISTSELASGVYLVTIVNNQGQRAVRKMIKR